MGMSARYGYVFIWITILLAAASSRAATWALEHATGLQADPAGYRNIERIRFNDMVEDDLGRLYIAIDLGNDTGSLTMGTGHLLILTPDGMGGWAANDITLSGYGPITKLLYNDIDGYVYGLQNWMPIEWTYDTGLDTRIVRIDPSGALNTMVNAASMGAWNTATNRLVDMTVGGDGLIYFTKYGADTYTKYHWFHRIESDGSVTESPNSPWALSRQENHRMWDLIYVNGKGGIDSFAVLGHHSTEAFKWNAEAMGWDSINGEPGWAFNYWRRYCHNGLSNPQWGRDRVTAIAYDPVTQQLWVGGRGAYEYAAFWNRSGNPGIAAEDPSAADNQALISDKIEDGHTCWRFTLTDSQYNDPAELTFETRFKITQASTAPDPVFQGYLMALACRRYSGYAAGANTPEIGLFYDGSDLKLINTHDDTPLANLGPASLNTWVTVRLYVNANTGVAKCWLGNGTSIYDGTVTVGENNGGAWFGASCSGDNLNVDPTGTTATVRFDHVKIAFAMLDPNLPTGEDWPDGNIGTEGGLAASHLTGSVLPEFWQSSCVMSRWSGQITEPSIYTGTGIPSVNPDPMPGIAGMAHWHVNGNDCTYSNQPNNGEYWVTALEADPLTGSAYVSLGTDSTYDWSGPYGQPGHVYTIEYLGSALSYDEGNPHSSPAQTVSLLVSSTKVYALSIDMQDGDVNLYSAELIPPQGACCLPDASCMNSSEIDCLQQEGVWTAGIDCSEADCRFTHCHDPFADADGDGDVDQADYAVFQACYTGRDFTGQLPTDPPCACFDVTDYYGTPDGKIDRYDLAAFENCRTAPGIPASPSCD